MPAHSINQVPRHTEEMQDIITAPPSSLIGWGIGSFCAIFVLLVLLAAFVNYPDIIKVPLKIVALNRAKPVGSQVSGKLVRLLVNNKEQVVLGQAVGYMESTVDHTKILHLLAQLKAAQKLLQTDTASRPIEITAPVADQLGELASSYSIFFQTYKSYRSLDSHQKLRFTQALDTFIKEVDDWKSNYVLSSPQSGKVAFTRRIQEGETVMANEPLFYIRPEKEKFYGEMLLPQDRISKVKVGQEVLIKLKSYPVEEFGAVKGKINFISDMLVKDSVFYSAVSLSPTMTSDGQKTLYLQQGMIGDAEIVTQKATVLKRIYRNFIGPVK